MKHHEKLLLALAAVLALASAGFFGWLAWGASSGAAPVATAALTGVAYAASGVDAPQVKTETWDLPAPQSRGHGWVYDVFSPPEIFYQPRTKQFSVTPPDGASDDPAPIPFGLELVGVRREPFRLQLIGFVAGPGSSLGTFENTVSGEVFLATGGRLVGSLGVTIRSFEVRLERIALPDSMTTTQRVATAVVRDERTGRDIVLTHRERKFADGVFAIVAAEGEPAPREVHAGDTFTTPAGTYRIEQITAAPATIEVTKQSPALPQPDRRTLTPRPEAEATEPPAP